MNGFVLLEISGAVLSIVPGITSGEPCLPQAVSANADSNC